MDNECVASVPSSNSVNINTRCVQIYQVGATAAQGGAVTAWDSTNFTITWTVSGSGIALVYTWAALA